MILLQMSVNRNISDHDGGDLGVCVEELAKISIPDVGIKPVSEVLDILKTSAAATLDTFQRFLGAARGASNLSDGTADQWKQKGNDDFNRGDFDVAGIHYTKAMTYAASDETLAVLLSNRSTVLFQQKRVKEALADAHYAYLLKRDYWKALLRRSACLRALGHATLAERDEVAAQEQKADLSCTDDELAVALERAFAGPFSPPPKFDLMESVQVQRDGKGRHVTAATRLEPQTVLLEEPYATAPRGEGMFTACSHCFHRTSTLYPSMHFRKTNFKSRGLFCSPLCADRQWKLYGEREVQNPFYMLCSVDTLLALRMIQTPFIGAEALRSREAPFDPLSDNQFGQAHMDMMVGYSKETAPFAEVGGKESVIAALAVHAGVVDARQAEKLRKAMRQILVNAFPITCVDRVIANAESHSFVTVTVGKALYAVASLFNHSCDPNCFVSYRGNPHASSGQLCVRLTRPVMEGEELTISYGNIDKTKMHSTRGRIRALRANYGFACTCAVCRNVVDEAVKKEDEAHYTKAADYYQKGRRLIREGNYADAITVLFQSYEIVMRYICPPPRPPQIMLPKTHDALAQAYLLNGDKAKCVEHLCSSLNLNRELHGGDYVDLVREYTRLAVLSGDVQYRDKALSLLDRYYCPSEFLETEKLYLLSSSMSNTGVAEQR